MDSHTLSEKWSKWKKVGLFSFLWSTTYPHIFQEHTELQKRVNIRVRVNIKNTINKCFNSYYRVFLKKKRKKKSHFYSCLIQSRFRLRCLAFICLPPLSLPSRVDLFRGVPSDLEAPELPSQDGHQRQGHSRPGVEHWLQQGRQHRHQRVHGGFPAGGPLSAWLRGARIWSGSADSLHLNQSINSTFYGRVSTF